METALETAMLSSYGMSKMWVGAVLWPENKSCDEDSGASPLCLVCCRGLGSPFLSAAELCQCSDFSERCHTWAWKRVVVRYLPCIREGWHILAFAFTSSNSSTLAMRRNMQWSLFLSLPQWWGEGCSLSKLCKKADEARSNLGQFTKSLAAGVHVVFISWNGTAFFIESSHKRVRLVLGFF